MDRHARLALAAIMLAWSAAPALALSQVQVNALNHVAQAFAGAIVCDRVEIDRPAIAAIYAVYGIDLDDPVQDGIVQSKVNDTVAGMRKTSMDGRCAAAMFLYGPDGQNVPGLLKWK